MTDRDRYPDLIRHLLQVDFPVAQAISVVSPLRAGLVGMGGRPNYDSYGRVYPDRKNARIRAGEHQRVIEFPGTRDVG